MSETKKRTKNLTRSRRLRKYEESYEACMDKVNPKSSSRHPKSPKLPKLSKLSKSPSSRESSKSHKLIKLDKADKLDKPLKDKESKKSRKSKSAESSHKPDKSSTNIPSRLSRSPKASPKACIESNMSRSPYKSPKKKRHLNNYQQFVKDESQKDTYKHLSSSERMTAIGKAWKALKI